uniref:Uncharacterized protein n=1 Tax=Lactuca sativa TaxID=4236 RepID=A0A9R1XWQ2_LACSA|nr:hypothetical protein LSAT_V11C200056430 [Lactuca sativa]
MVKISSLVLWFFGFFTLYLARIMVFKICGRKGFGFLQSCMALWKDPQGRALVSWYGGVLVIEKGVKGGDILSVGICVLYGGLCLGVWFITVLLDDVSYFSHNSNGIHEDLNVKSYYKKLLNLLKKVKLASNSKALKTTFGATQVLTALATSFHALKPFKVPASGYSF